MTVSYGDTIRTKCVKRSLKDGPSLFGTDLANALNNHFPSISVDLPPIDLCSLPAYLPLTSPCARANHYTYGGLYEAPQS